MPRNHRARPVRTLLPATDMVASSVGGGVQQGGQPLLLRVTGSGGSAGTTADQDPSPLILADGTGISFVEHH